MKRLNRPAMIWLLRVVVFLIVVLIFFYAEEDWRGARAWAACQRDLAAKGETLDLRQLAPPGKPEDDLSKVPIFAPLDEKEVDPQAPIEQVAIELGAPYSADYPKSSSYLRGQSFDLAAWQKYYRTLPSAHLTGQGTTPAQDVLEVLRRFDPPMNAVDAALSNPEAHWPFNYDRPFETSFRGVTQMIRLAKILQLRGIAHLENGETDLAEKDYLFSFRLNRPLARQGTVISFLISAGVRAIDDSILFEGLRRHAWNASQLQEMESGLALSDILAAGANSLRFERASALQSIKYTQVDDPRLAHGDEDISFFIGVLHWLRLRPSGWWDLDRCAYSLGMQRVIDSIDLNRSILIPPEVIPEEKNPTLKIFRQIYLPLSTSVLTIFENIDSKIAQAETYRRLARLACRLEEYRLAQGHYPNQLTDLPDLPAHLNQEVLSEKPLRYQRKGEGYLLYSIGWNQKDHGGVMAPDMAQGDWVWPSP
jgi:hypothetical protein